MRRECIVQMGYFPDAFADYRQGPDVFFLHLYTTDESMEWDLARSVDALVQACREKYRVEPNPLDLFWECSPRPTDEEVAAWDDDRWRD